MNPQAISTVVSTWLTLDGTGSTEFSLKASAPVNAIVAQAVVVTEAEGATRRKSVGDGAAVRLPRNDRAPIVLGACHATAILAHCVCEAGTA